MRLYEDSLTVGAQKVDLAADGEIHNNLILPAGGRSAIRYFTPLRPPLMSTQPADCDGGDLLISLSWRTDAMLKTQKTKVIFLFNTQSRKMELSDFVREPSRLTESELREWLKEEKITEYEFNQLLEVSSIDRYFIAFSDNSSRPYELSMPLARKLRKLVGNHHKFFGYEDY